MIRKLPIVVPDLPYAKSVCGDSPFYFDINSKYSFSLSAINNAVKYASKEKYIDYTDQLVSIPKDWVYAKKVIRFDSKIISLL